MAAPVPPGAPRPGSNTAQPPPPNYIPNIRGTPEALADNMQNLNLNRPPMTSNPVSRPPPFGQPPPFSSSAPSPGIPGSSPPFSRPGPPPGAMVRPAGPPTGPPFSTVPPNVAPGRPTGPLPGQPPSFVSRPPPNSLPPSSSSAFGASPVSGAPPPGPISSLAPPPPTLGGRPGPSPSPFISPPISTPPVLPPTSASGNLMSNGPPVFSAGPMPGPQRFPVSSVPQHSVGPPPTMRAPPGPPVQPQPPYPNVTQGIMQPPSSPFGAPTWQMQSQQVAPPPPVPGPSQGPRMFGMQPPLPNQSMTTTISPAVGQTGAPMAGPSKIDPNQIPRPTPGSSVILHDTRQGNQATIPPPATSDFIVRDTGNCSPRYMKSTINQIPFTADLLTTSGMQLAMLVQPLALPHPSEEPIQVVDFGESGPVRCSRCKAYINPFMKFIDQGRRFICNLCGFSDETPRDYHCNLGPDGRRRDADERPELCRGTVEFVATKEFMVRDPMPAVYFFLIDVSMNAVQTGATAAACSAITRVIKDKDLPEGPRTLVGVATFDSTIHFYNLKRALQQPLMLIVPDVQDVYTPLQTDVIVPLSECRQHLELLLESIPTMFQNNRTSESAFGAAIKAAFLAMKDTGGKLLVFQSVLPSIGIGALSAREAEGRTNISAGEKEAHKLLQPADKAFKELAVEFAEYQVCVDVFVTTQTYVDIASISAIPRTTGGQKQEVKEALKRMSNGKAVGPDNIPIEVWKTLGDRGLEWLTKLFNEIMRSKRMPEEWRRSTLVPIYKNKGDIQNCANYRGIKLMSHTMKLWERVIERRLRKETQVTENQFGFMPGRSTMEAIYLLRRVMEQYRMDQQDLHLIFIDLEKAYDRVPREILWKALEKKGVRVAYIRAIQDMYDRVSTSVRTQGGESDDFPITIGLHQGSTLSPYLFTLILDVLTEQIQEIALRCMLFADDIVLLGESREELNERLETWRRALETHGFRLSRSKSEYMECKFNKSRRVSNSEVKIGDHIIPQVTRFKYLGSVIQDDGEIEGDVNHRIQAGWMKWRKASGVLCDAKVPIKLKGKFYRTAVRPAILYGTECWAVKSQHETKVGVAEMRMLRWMCGKTRQDKIRNGAISERVGVAPIVEKMVENRLRWFGHVERRPVDSVVRRVDQMERRQTIRGRERPKKTIREVIKKDLELNDLDRSMVYYYYPFSALSDTAKLYNDLRWNITRPQGFEAVMRVRCSQGIQVQEYYGNFCKRIPTDVDLPGIDCDKTFMVTLKHDDKLQDGSECAIQCALLYTTVYGQRRIRVITLSLPVTSMLSNLFRAADLDTQFCCFLKQAASEIPSKPLPLVREQVTNLCINALFSYRKFCATVSSSGQLILPEALKLLPLYTLALTKSTGLRTEGKIDERSFWINYVSSISAPLAIPLVYPRMMAIHDLDSKEDDDSVIPPFLPLSSEHISDDGIYLLENGHDCLIYVGDSVNPDIVQKLFGVATVDKVPTLQYDNPLSKKLNEVVNEIRRQRCSYFRFKLCRKGDPSVT
ncbi:Protein transport protein Sec24-like [Glycine max]|nr:Protein transport protein Sec24-like [Glycine max]